MVRLKRFTGTEQFCHLKFAPSKLDRIRESLAGNRTCSDEVPRKSKRQATCSDNTSCIFCFKMDGKLHQCSGMKLDTELRYMATELNDTTLLARISGGGGGGGGYSRY